MRMAYSAGLACLGLMIFISPGTAGIIDVGDHVLLSDTAGQLITLDVSGGEEVIAGAVYVQIADGLPPSSDAPVITGLDIINGTVFDGNNLGHLGSGQITPQAWDESTYTLAESEPLDGLVATVSVDTTGFDSGIWALLLESNLGQTSFLDEFGGVVALEILAGTIRVGALPVPEPTTCSLALFGMVALAWLWRRRRA